MLSLIGKISIMANTRIIQSFRTIINAINQYRYNNADGVSIITKDKLANESFINPFTKYIPESNINAIVVKDLIINNQENHEVGNLAIQYLNLSCEGIIFINCIINGSLSFTISNKIPQFIFLLDCEINGRLFFNNNNSIELV